MQGRGYLQGKGFVGGRVAVAGPLLTSLSSDLELFFPLSYISSPVFSLILGRYSYCGISLLSFSYLFLHLAGELSRFSLFTAYPRFKDEMFVFKNDL